MLQEFSKIIVDKETPCPLFLYNFKKFSGNTSHDVDEAGKIMQSKNSRLAVKISETAGSRPVGSTFFPSGLSPNFLFFFPADGNVEQANLV